MIGGVDILEIKLGFLGHVNVARWNPLTVAQRLAERFHGASLLSLGKLGYPDQFVRSCEREGTLGGCTNLVAKLLRFCPLPVTHMNHGGQQAQGVAGVVFAIPGDFLKRYRGLCQLSLQEQVLDFLAINQELKVGIVRVLLTKLAKDLETFLLVCVPPRVEQGRGQHVASLRALTGQDARANNGLLKVNRCSVLAERRAGLIARQFSGRTLTEFLPSQGTMQM